MPTPKTSKSKLFLKIVILMMLLFLGASSVSAVEGSITKTLRYGMKDTQVKYLQQFLNEKGYIVSRIGAGSVGLETTYFGKATDTAVKAYQRAKGLVADGIFGTKSRASLSGILTFYSTPVVTNYPAGCISSIGYSPYTGVRCDGSTITTYPTGCSSTLGFSALTGRRCDGTVQTTTFTTSSGSKKSGGGGGGGGGGGSTPTPTPALTVSISVNSTSVSYNNSATLTWSSTNATSCTASGAWSGTKATSGTESTGSLTSTKIYTLTCSGVGGNSSNSGAVSVGVQPVMSGTLTSSASSCLIASGTKSCNVNFTWMTTNPQAISTVTKPVNINVATGNAGTNVSFAVKYNSETFYLYNNSTFLAQSTVTASCVSGTVWNGSICAPPPSIVCPTVIPKNVFSGCYYNGKDFNTLAFIRNDSNPLNFDWNTSAPAVGVNSDLFSVRWQGDFSFQASSYNFTVTADDGVRLYVDNELLINQWKNQAATTYTAIKTLTAGEHLIKLEYYENLIYASAKLAWTAIEPTAKSNQAPSISLTAPTNNSTYTTPANIIINASASDSDGTISKVEFYNGTALLSSDFTSPYTFTWRNVLAGNYSLSAKAYDNLNAVTTSTSTNVMIKSATPLPSSVGLYTVYEQSFTHSGTYANPYYSVDADANVTTPSGRKLTVPMFWDGGTTWKFRIAPTEVGTYTYTTQSADAGLNAKTGSFTASNTGNKGFIIRDPNNNYAFKYSGTGEHVLMMGDTCWNCFSNVGGNLSNALFKQYIDKRASQKFNFMRSYIVPIYQRSE